MKRSKQTQNVNSIAAIEHDVVDLEATVAKLCRTIDLIRSGSELEARTNERDAAIRIAQKAISIIENKSSISDLYLLKQDLNNLLKCGIKI